MTRLRVKGYIGRRLRRHLSKIFHGLLENIAIEKRNHALIQRVRSRWQNVCVFKTFNAWASDVRETKRQRQLMQRFKQRWLNMSIARAYDAWISCVAERKRLRQTMTVTLNRLKSASLMRAMASWRSCVFRPRRFRLCALLCSPNAERRRSLSRAASRASHPSRHVCRSSKSRTACTGSALQRACLLYTSPSPRDS